MKLPRYPVYVPSKSRYETCFTADCLVEDEVPFSLVVEKEEVKPYAERYGKDRLLVLPKSDQGLIYARNWIKEHATKAGAERHWQIDDNIKRFRRLYKKKRIPVMAGIALALTEDFVDRYENVAIAGLCYSMFAGPLVRRHVPFYVNHHVYSCTLVLNEIPYRWRSRYNDDTDMCLQVLAGGWCTILMNAFMVDKIRTMTVKGGNTPIYEGDGRLKMAKAMERLWPGVVETGRRFKRPQHVVKDQWRRFDTPLKLKPGIDLAAMGLDEHGMVLSQEKEIRAKGIKSLMEEQ